LSGDSRFKLVRICREGEAWTIAAGLHMGGARPMVVMQSTGLFESGDALRNVYFDLGLPIWSLIGYRSYLLAQSSDSAKRFCEPILKAWSIDYLLVERPDVDAMLAHWRKTDKAGAPGVVLMAEGKG
jgi:sulfopyruvate decarboxylase TPP-binding subunit